MDAGPGYAGLAVVVGGGLAATGAAVGAASRTWATASSATLGRPDAVVAGSDVAPLAVAAALVGLACWGAFLVLRTTGRRVVAVLGAVASLVCLVAVLSRAGDAAGLAAELLTDAGDGSGATAWPTVTAVAAAASLVAFVLAFRAAARWPQMSRRYDSVSPTPVPAAEATPADLWRALDEGEDPTADER